MQPRMTSHLCLKRSLTLRSSTFNSEWLRHYDGVREVEGDHEKHPAKPYQKPFSERTLPHFAQVENGRAEDERRQCDRLHRHE
jgi:hypothetical protein